MPSSVRLTSGALSFTPGVFTTVDASALAATSPDATGIVALIGEAVGGAPYTAYIIGEDLPAFTTAAGLARAYPAGDLLEAANFAFAPSGVTGGAQIVVPVKANPATQAHITLNGPSAPALTLTAQSWGMLGNGISVQVAAGSTSGIKLTIKQGQQVETGDNLGDDPVGKLTYDASAGWGALFATKDASALSFSGTTTAKAEPGQVTKVALTSPSVVSIQADQSDLGKTLTLYGTTSAGAAQVETIVLTGGSQASAGTFARLVGVSLSDAAQSVKVLDGAGAVLAELPTNATEVGLATLSPLAVANGPVSVKGTVAGELVLLVGVDTVGGQVTDVVTTQANTAVAGTKAFAKVTAVVVGALSADVQLSAKAASVPTAGDTSLRMAKGALAAVPGLVLELTKGDEDTPVAGLDAIAGLPLSASALTLLSDIEAVVDWVNDNSQLVTARVAPGAREQPAATPQPLFLAGGSESPATFADYKACLALLKRRRVNLVVPLTCDQAVAKAVEAHCALMAGTGQSERMAHLGAQDPTLTKPASKAQAISQAAALNSAYVCLHPNGVVRYDTLGNLTTYAPWMTAVGCAGMRAGSRVNTPLTRKALDVVALTQDKSYDPVDDSDELIAAGVAFLARMDGIGVAIKRDITTWTRDNNPVFSSGMVAFATGANIYLYRLNLQAFVGQDGFVGSVNHVVTQAVTVLSQMKIDQRIFDFTPPTGVRQGDTLLIDQTWQYDPETNFILPTIHIVNPVAAAA